ncbi:hypothetical protein [Erwinia mallotivora]|uniref:hypothetical protein n=1 Tax=Erwinia mallotivora TaxID=69222 RepID=UPI0021C0799E|nr:hypothetical protein [Erwinia mallotivora]
MLSAHPVTGSSLSAKISSPSDSSNSKNQNIWFNAFDYVDMEDSWFDTSEEHHAAPTASARKAADSRVPFTQDCLQGIQQLVRTLAEYRENRMLSACLASILPDTPTSLVITANSLYTAITERRHIDSAALHALGLASAYLPDNFNVVSSLAAFIRESVTGWTGDNFLQQFVGEEESSTSTHLFTALAITAIVAGSWMKDEGAAQPGLLRVPAFMANIFIRASYYRTVLGNMARALPSGEKMPENNSPSPHAPVFEVDSQVEMLKVPLEVIKKHDDIDIYMQLNPETGERFGKKYVLDSEGALQPYVRKKIKNKK